MVSNNCMPENGLTISIVTYFPDIKQLIRTLASLKSAIDYLNQHMSIVTHVTVVDNSVNNQVATEILELLESMLVGISQLETPSVNIGYGLGHNLAAENGIGRWHLVMNSDIELDEDALSTALIFLEQPDNQAIGLISPRCLNGNGEQAYLCKRYPSVLDLALRGFAPSVLRQFFKARLANYECRDYSDHHPVKPVRIVSGCFMFFRKQAWQSTSGFSAQYFLYFEDFDLCIRLDQAWQIAYVPTVQIVHHGGHAARKGLKHVVLFIRSAYCFFSSHGWSIV